MQSELLTSIPRSIIKSVLTYNIAVWYGNSTESDRRRLQRVVKYAQ